MSQTLFVTNNFVITALGGLTEGRQGLPASGWTDPYGLTVQGLDKSIAGALATASVVNLFTSGDALQAWAYFFLWADQPLDLQIIGSGSNVILPIAPYLPFVLSGGRTMLAAVSTTPITGGAAPALTNIAAMVLGNYSGQTANFRGAFIG